MVESNEAKHEERKKGEVIKEWKKQGRAKRKKRCRAITREPVFGGLMKDVFVPVLV